MLSHTDLKRGVRFILENQPYEVMESSHLKMAQRRPVVQTKIRNLVTGNVYERNFQQGDLFEEAELEKINVKYLYNNRGNHFFCLLPHQTSTTSLKKEKQIPSSLWCGSEKKDPSKRFSLQAEQIGSEARFLKPNEVMEGVVFNEKIINIIIPIKIQLKVKQSPPGVKGNRSQGGTKSVLLESGAEINVPLFIKEGDIVEVNTKEGEYVRRIG